MQKPWQFQKSKTPFYFCSAKTQGLFIYMLTCLFYYFHIFWNILHKKHKYLWWLLSFYYSHIFLVLLSVLFLYLFNLFNIFTAGSWLIDYLIIIHGGRMIYINNIHGRNISLVYLVNIFVDSGNKSGGISNINGWSLQAVKSAGAADLLLFVECFLSFAGMVRTCQ